MTVALYFSGFQTLGGAGEGSKKAVEVAGADYTEDSFLLGTASLVRPAHSGYQCG